MATKQQVIDRAANNLGVLPFGQTLSIQDNTRITSAYEEVYDSLKEDGYATWASDGEVPDRLVEFMAGLVANNCLSSYGVSESRFQRVKLEAQIANKEIKRLAVSEYYSTDDPTDF